ncbi:G protein-coupled receptor 88 [Denticeps clupeoides]|uniref:G protein-coupled receptor 88 n=1 Tax=Denticeps clupeoides TaxID=299321 RepID=UPI0010A510A0|nr:probable G-protein coupled receptor 88 [Denticeps clupeoides]
MGAAGVAPNLLVIYLALRVRKLRTATNAFIANGCAANLLVCAFWMPHEAAAVSGVGPAAPGYHAFREALLLVGVAASLLSHSLVAVNRYVLITKAPATYQNLYQKRRAEWMIGASWLVALGCAAPWVTSAGRAADRGPCANATSRYASALSEPRAAATLALCIVGQTPVVLYCYFKIFRRVQVSVKRVSVLNFQVVTNLPYSFPRRDKRLGRYVLAVCFAFCLATQPLLWVLVAGLFVEVPGALRTSLWLLFCTLFVTNPFLYTWKNEEFRKSLRAVVRGEHWRGSAVGAEPAAAAVSAVSHVFPRQNSRRAFLEEMN